MEPVARDLLDADRGAPRAYGRELRYGRRGSLSVDLGKGCWFDHEAGVGGGVIDLVKHVRGCGDADARAWFRERGHLPGDGGRRLPARRRLVGRSGNGQKGRPPAPGAASEDPRAALVCALWAAAEPLLDGPARHYLESRGVWNPGGFRWVRWLPRKASPAPVPEVRWWGLPRGACGALVCAYVRLGAVAAVSLEALDSGGVRVPERWRRTCGARAGAAFRARECGAILHVAEGEMDALALARRETGSVYGLGGTSGLTRVLDVVGEHRRVVVHADSDSGGRRGAVWAVGALRAAGLRASLVWYREDPAADSERCSG